MLSSLDRPGLVVFGGILGRHPRSSSEDDLLLPLLVGLFEVGGRDPLDRLYSSL